MLENSWNVSIRNIYNLLRQTQWYLIEPISEHAHLRTLLIKKSCCLSKRWRISVKQKFHTCWNYMHECRSICGNNLSKILLQTSRISVTQLNPSDAFHNSYNSIQETDYWNPSKILIFIDVLHGNMELSGFEREEIFEMVS